MKSRTAISAVALAAGCLTTPPLASRTLAAETIVFVRHGEKPAEGLGQLSCRGLNRALALPRALAAFGKPSAIFAPDPADRKRDHGKPFAYVRPLATIEPTAIALGLPVDTRFGVSGLDGLRRSLTRPALREATALVGWEHKQIVILVRRLLAAHGGDPRSVPPWSDDDFDSIYVVSLDWSGARSVSSMRIAHEGLNGLSDQCPQGASPAP